MMLVWTLVAMIISCVNGIDNNKLKVIPPPMKGFNWDQYLGRWYYQFRKPTCSYLGSNDFTDFEAFLSPESKQSVKMTLTMRNEICNTITSRITFNSYTEAVMNQKDPVGGSFSGLYVQVAGNPKAFRIFYGCTKLSMTDNTCEDAGISISTRMPYPNKKIIAEINAVLMQLWGVTVDQLTYVPKTQSCVAKNYVEPISKWLPHPY